MSDRTIQLLVMYSHTGAYLWTIPIGVALAVAASRAGKRRSVGRLAGDARAVRAWTVRAWILGAMCLAMLPAFVVGFIHFGCAVAVSRETRCLSNVRRRGMAICMYSQDWDERLPVAARWADGLQRYGEAMDADTFRCPTARSPAGYAMNAALGGALLGDIEQPAETIFLFEADAPRRSFAGGVGDVAWVRHGYRPAFAFADGHARYVQRARATGMLWSIPPKPKGDRVPR